MLHPAGRVRGGGEPPHRVPPPRAAAAPAELAPVLLQCSLWFAVRGGAGLSAPMLLAPAMAPVLCPVIPGPSEPDGSRARGPGLQGGRRPVSVGFPMGGAVARLRGCVDTPSPWGSTRVGFSSWG